MGRRVRDPACDHNDHDQHDDEHDGPRGNLDRSAHHHDIDHCVTDHHLSVPLSGYFLGVRRFLAAAVIALTVASCGADPSGTPGTASSVDRSAGPAGAAQATLIGGGTLDIGALSRERPVALWFWAPG